MYDHLVEDPESKGKVQECLDHMNLFLIDENCRPVREVINEFMVTRLGLDMPVEVGPVEVNEEGIVMEEVSSSSSDQQVTFKVKIKREGS